MKIVLVGTGGYATMYVRALLDNTDPDVVFEGVVDPYLASGKYAEELIARRIPAYDDLEAFYCEHDADLAIISTPPFLHLEQSLTALRHGSYVLCEKPAAPTVEEVEQMIAAEKQYGRFIAIGYQWSFSDAILALKRDVMAGALGKPLSFRTFISWPRDYAYYRRGGGWGGKMFRDGKPLYDSIASNACAHYLHNMLFLLGDRIDRAAMPESIEAECLRANDIESFDTCTIRAKAAGVELYFAATHAAEQKCDPVFVYTFEGAEVRYAQKGDYPEITAVFPDGSTRIYGDPFAKPAVTKMWDCIRAVREGTTPVCTAETAIAHTHLIGMLHASTPIHSFPTSLIRETPEADRRYVEGLYETLHQAYLYGQLLSERS